MGDVGVRLPVHKFSLEAKDYQVKLYALLYELESWFEIDYAANNHELFRCDIKYPW